LGAGADYSKERPRPERKLKSPSNPDHAALKLNNRWWATIAFGCQVQFEATGGARGASVVWYMTCMYWSCVRRSLPLWDTPPSLLSVQIVCVMTSALPAPAPSVAMATVARQSMVAMTTIIWLRYVGVWRSAYRASTDLVVYSNSPSVDRLAGRCGDCWLGGLRGGSVLSRVYQFARRWTRVIQWRDSDSVAAKLFIRLRSHTDDCWAAVQLVGLCLAPEVLRRLGNRSIGFFQFCVKNRGLLSVFSSYGVFANGFGGCWVAEMETLGVLWGEFVSVTQLQPTWEIWGLLLASNRDPLLQSWMNWFGL